MHSNSSLLFLFLAGVKAHLTDFLLCRSLSFFFGQQPAWVIRIAAALERWDWLRLQRTFLSNSDSILFMFPRVLTHQQYMLLWNTYVLRVTYPFWGYYGVGAYQKWLSVRGRVHPGQFAHLLQGYTERQPTIHTHIHIYGHCKITSKPNFKNSPNFFGLW